MSLSEILDRVQPWCPGWERASGRKSLLQLAQQCIDLVFSVDHASLIFRPGNTLGNEGFPPYLITTAGTFKYPITSAYLSCGANINHVAGSDTVTFIPRKVRRILVDITNIGYNDFPYSDLVGGPISDPFGLYGASPSRSLFRKINITTTVAMTANSGQYIPPTVTFVNDPGSETEKYFIEFYVMPQRLTVDTVEIPLPMQFEQMVEDFIRGRVQELESGTQSPIMQKFNDYWIPKFEVDVFSTTTVQSTSTPPNYI